MLDGASSRLGNQLGDTSLQMTSQLEETATRIFDQLDSTKNTLTERLEVTATDVQVLAPSVDYPITPKEHGTSFLFEHRHLWLRSRKQVAIARVRHEVEQAIHDFFYARGFIRTDSPILTGAGSYGKTFSSPLPQALMLGAGVVGMASLVLALALAVRVREAYGAVDAADIAAADDGQDRADQTEAEPR